MAADRHSTRPRIKQPILVGRDWERTLLGDLLDDAIQGRGALVLVSGEAGIGKTTLIDNVARDAAEQGMLVLSGGCYDLTTTPPYGPWVELLRAYPCGPDLPAPPDVLHETDGLEQIASQEHLFRIVADFVGDIAAATPVILILEDLHWSDVASIDLLRCLARQLPRQRIVMLASYRDDELPRSHPLFTILPLLVREARAERLELQPFDGEVLRAFVEHQYSLSSDDTRALASYLFQHTEGNPLFTAELLRSLEREQILVEGARGWRLGGLDQVVPPPLVVQVIERQLATLDPATRDALEIAALIGQDISLDLWREVAKLDEETLSAVVEQALVARIIEPQGRMGLRFRHALIREVLYQGMLFPKRRRIHREAAETLMAAGSPDADAVAYHFQHAGDERALEWLIRAGDNADRTWAVFTAMERYEAALRLLEDDEARLRERGWVLLALGETGRDVVSRRALACIEEAQRIAERIGDDALKGWTLFSHGENSIFLGQNGLAELEHGYALIRQSPPTSPPELPSRFRRRHRYVVESNVMDADIIVMQALFGYYREALARAEVYLGSNLPENDFHLTLRGHAEVARAVALGVLGDPEGSTVAFRNAHDAYRRAKSAWHRSLIATAELEYVALAYRTDQITERQRLATEVEVLWTQGSGLITQYPPRFGLLPLLVIEGAWTEVRELALPFANHNVFYYFALYALGVIARAQGEPELAWVQVRAALPDGFETEPGAVWMLSTMELQRLAADLALDAGDTELACQWIQAHDRWLEWSERVQGRAEAQILWARYHQVAGDPETAYLHAEQALEHARDPRQPLALIAAYRMLGQLDIERGHFVDAEQYLRDALDWAEACAAPYEQALTLLALAELSAAAGKPDDAWAQLTRARAICTPLGATPALQHATAIAAKLSVRRGKPVHPAGLTSREVEVLRLVAGGLTDTEVAGQLFISPRTVGQHLRSVYNKLGVNSRVEATRFAVEQGLTDSSSR